MEDFRRTYLRVCKEGGVEPQESILAQLQGSRGALESSRLDLRGHSLSADTCSVLGRVLRKDTLFIELALSDCMLSEEGAKLLLNGLCANTTVKVLDLKGNNLRSTGAEALGKLLATNKTLRRLVLEWNALGMWDEAFSIFCEGLASNTNLSQLDLRNNQINHQGASELSLALKRNSTLQELDLRWNNIGLLGGRSVLEALQHNRTLVQLEMAGNNIPSDTLKALEQAMEHNSDRQSTLRESRSRTQVLSKEIQILKEEKGRQFLNLMETIDKQRDEMGRSSRSASTSIHVGQLQEALNDRKSVVNSLTAKLQMTEAALTLSEQKNHNLQELLGRLKSEKDEQRNRQSRERKKEQEDSVLREGKLLREMNNMSETSLQLKNKVDEMERRCKTQQDVIFELKQELTNSTAELKLRLAQAEERLDLERKRSKQAVEDIDGLRQKEVDHVNRHLEESERGLQERILKLEGQRIHLEEELSRAKAACVTERAQADEEMGKVRSQIRLEEQQNVSALEDKLRALRQSRDESQSHCTQQKQSIAELQARNSQQSLEMDGLRRRIDELQQELSGKDQERVAEVSRVRVELQEHMGHLQAERTAQGGLKEKIAALEREMKGVSSSHREALLDRESEIASLCEKLRLRDAEIQRMREDEAQRASFLQSAILTYVQGSPLHYSPKK
ncbi:leucine-rich repeat-containing protein 45 isoform X1 [Hypomesus transpacificus]|uniref:leucine-rich repeat-containing protein 45 isoform X1 n=1 Tax=Hypomesus transpacificus TaxID=137520 RepID=UPI001F076194|nr:leucine-rich repeat-containing protein 45 isoform X1 [Hypomesus transpacificus]XP_046888785.1 leucine-rich repeat-containing protein 45 isoform X1 [Hypomesus transpacificus]XP_046888786.1 leucine-rich repeat-containing protein 45 isoform X1 [Hypomesus transpacificus]XP_046888787.1 leucine-rich repeat-containing protein 45 isoform X1 [Hypomesus transpacificus]